VNQRKLLRCGVAAYDGEIRQIVGRQMLELAAHAMNSHPDMKDFPRNLSRALRRLTARYAVANYLLFLRKLQTGGHLKVGAAHLENDLSDMMYVAYATYFDGILSKEKMVNELYRDLNIALGWFD